MKDLYKVVSMIEELGIGYTLTDYPVRLKHRAIFHDRVDGDRDQSVEYHFNLNGKFQKMVIVDSRPE